MPTKLHLFWIGIVSALLFRWASSEEGRVRMVLTAWIITAGASLLLLPYRPYVGLWVWVVVFAAVLSAQNDSKSFARRAMATLASRPVLFFGLMSYPIYLAHEPWLWFCQNMFDGQLHGTALAAATFVASIPIVLGTAFALHHWIELPFIRWGRARFRTSPIPAAAT